MIELKDVSKRYRRPRMGFGPWVFKDVSLIIPPGRNIGVIGAPGTGKTTFLNLLCSVDKPTRGTIDRKSKVSWMVGKGAGLQSTMTGRQNATFVCRLFCHGDYERDRLEFIEKFSELGPAFNQPVATYSGSMTARLRISLSLAFDFDIYISDGTVAVGVGEFRKKVAARFLEQTKKGGLVLASSSSSILQRYCENCIWVKDGKAIWYDDISDALRDYKECEVEDMDAVVLSDE
ncbi:MAG: ATP-binding cassette domain-containing protein [Pseudomonadota bacterium]